MTACDVYIGDLDDPEFHWDGGDWNGNVPRAIASVFPPVGGHYNTATIAGLESVA